MRIVSLSGIVAAMKPRRKQREKRTHAGIWAIVIVLAGLGMAGYGFYQGFLALIDDWCKDLPSVQDTDAFELPEQSTIYASDGTTVLAELYMEKRSPVTIDQVSPYVLQGTVATEDVRFYQHGGVDLQGILRAVIVNLSGGQEGASTITQQYVRNTILSSEMNDISIKRKVREMTLANEMEKIYSKDEILLMYLNTINYGDNCYGIQAAARHYYSTDASDLTIAQAATLIGIPNSPTMYNPNTNPDNAIDRRNVVLSRMLTNGVITQEEYESAKAEDLNLQIEEDEGTNGIYLYKYFTSYIRDQILETYDHEQVFEGGLKIVTTIDPEMQEYAEEAVQKQYDSGRLAASNQEFALTLVDPNTGFIKAMIGGRDYDSDQYNIATSSTGVQTGSTFKAFTLTDAIEKGINPQTTYMNCDAGPVEVNGAKIYNYGHSNYGTMTIANMTAISSNTGYMRLITDSTSGVTPESVKKVAERLGLNSSNIGTAPTITLGVYNANTTEMASAYGTFATGGVYRSATGILTVTDRNGNVLFDNTSGVEGEQVLTDSVAYAVTRVLEGVINNTSYGTATAARLSSGQIAAGKTGTTDDYHDLWFVGYTPQLSCAVWTGSRDNTAELMTNTWCQDIWRDLMTNCLAGQEIQDFKSAEDPAYTSSFKGSYSASTSNSSSLNSSSEEADTSADNSSSSNGNDARREEGQDDSVAPQPNPDSDSDSDSDASQDSSAGRSA